jgi:SAM-dependent methyltransferase
MMYGKLCTMFYDGDKKFADDDEVNFYKKYFDKNAILLEPMCGSGRLLIPLMQAGFTVHGLDNSSAMLESCQKRASKLGLQPILHVCDVEKMNLSTKYDGLIIPFGSFQLFYPRSRAHLALEIFKKHLKSGGKLIMDLFIPWDALYENNDEVIDEREVKVDNDTIININNHTTANKFEQVLFSKTRYSEIVKGQVTAKEEEEMYISWYYQYEAELLLENHGFKNIKYVTRFLNHSDHMTFIAEM